MRFAPKPENDFAHYIRTYYDECRLRCEKIEAIAGKWMFRDLLPGMSDFDTRFIVSDDMTADDWCRMSTAVGEAHLALCRQYPSWRRNLEHLPGVNLTWNELTSARHYYPEYKQWSFYHTELLGRLGEALEVLRRRPWDRTDEYFHLKKFCLYFGRYDRKIDPPVNMGMHADKYPMHSRLMHYFTPPVHAAMNVLLRQTLVGKYEALEAATERFGQLQCWDAVWELIHDDYETPRWYEEPHLTKLEDLLEDALRSIAAELRPALTLMPKGVGVDVPAWRKILAQTDVDPAIIIFDNVKFCRLMKGRLHFFANAPAHFDSTWLIQVELGRIGRNFFVTPFRVYWKLATGEEVENPVEILDRLRGELLDDAEVEATKRFAQLTSSYHGNGNERELALAIVDVYDDFFRALCKLTNNERTVLKHENQKSKT